MLLVGECGGDDDGDDCFVKMMVVVVVVVGGDPVVDGKWKKEYEENCDNDLVRW